MANPSSSTPFFHHAKAKSYEAEHENGVSTTTVTLAGTTVQYFFGSDTNGFRGTITGLWLTQIVGTSQTVTVEGTGGVVTICTISGSATAGSVLAPDAALANTAIDLNGTVSVVSDNAVDTSLVTITYKTDID